MHSVIHLLYHDTYESHPLWNWVMPRGTGAWWDEVAADTYCIVSTLKKDLANSPNLSYTHVSKLVSGMKWMYELNWFYGSANFEFNSDILDKFLSNSLLVEGLNNGSGYLILNLAMEGWCSTEHISRIEKFFVNKGIPLDRVIYLTGALNAAELFSAANYSMQPLCVRTMERSAAALPISSQKCTAISKRFLCFNRLYRIHRVMLLGKLQLRNLLPQFYYSFPASSNGENAIEYASKYIPDTVTDKNTIVSALRKIQLPLILDTDNWTPNLAQHHTATSVTEFYAKSGISVVTETLFRDNEILLTEKIFHPIRFYQPFIIVGAAGSLKMLHKLGYKTFSAWVDESYDDVQDPDQRLDAITDVISVIATWTDEQFSKFLTDSYDICEHNAKTLTAAINASYSEELSQLFG